MIELGLPFGELPLRRPDGRDLVEKLLSTICGLSLRRYFLLDNQLARARARRPAVRRRKR